MISLGLDFSRGIRELRAAPEDNAMWAIYQIQHELARTQIAAMEIDPADATTADAFIRRFDIFYSRFGLLNVRSPVTQPIEPLQNDQAWADLKDFFVTAGHITEKGPATVLANKAEILGGLKRIEPSIRKLVLGALQQSAARSDERRLSLISTANAGGLLIVSLMMTLSGFILMLVLQACALLASQRALESSEQQKSAIIAASLDAIIVTDQQGVVLEGNAATADLFGHPPESLYGQSIIAAVVPQRLRTRFRRLLARGLGPLTLRRGKRIEMAATRADGHELPVEISLTAAPGQNGPILIIYARDITRRKAQARATREAQARAERESQAKARFVAFVSHELRTPLSSLLLTLDLLRQPHREEDRVSLIAAAILSSEALLTIVNDVLDLSRIEADSMRLETGPCRFDTLAREAAAIVTPAAIRKGNVISVATDPAAEGFFEAAGGRIRQILLNLLTNANRFTQNGQISVKITRSSAEEIMISVSDTGSGIAPERLDTIFDEFTTGTTDIGNDALQMARYGTGLGLPISRALALRMGGQISVESQLGNGSIFRLKVPVRAVEGELPSELAAGAPTSDAGAAHPANVLIIDDDRLNAAALARHLESAGHRVTLARNGEDGVKAVASESFELIFLDLLMPGMDGAETARRIRALGPDAARIPIIAITAYASALDRARFDEAGVAGYLQKPLRRDGILGALYQYITPARRDP